MIRRPYEPDAGPWVAYQDKTITHAKTGEPVTVRSYPRNHEMPWHSWTTAKADALRFDTKAEALAFIRSRSPRRRGVRTGAERIT